MSVFAVAYWAVVVTLVALGLVGLAVGMVLSLVGDRAERRSVSSAEWVRLSDLLDGGRR
jgi:xanthine/uracil permease